MKFLSEYRDADLAKKYLDGIHATVTQPWNIMEVCGGQTHSLVKNGIMDLLPKEVQMIHGPGCPVCVTPLHLIDKAIHLAEEEHVILCSFGDMLRVPGSEKSLLQAKAAGADIRILYSPLEAVQIASDNPSKEVVFFAVGFETTAPANALSIDKAHDMGLTNFSILASQVLVPPAMEAVIEDEESKIDAFLAAGHVCTIMGMDDYYPLVTKYKIPMVVTGFEPVDLLQGVLLTVQQLEKGEAVLQNQYSRVVKPKGNLKAQELIHKIFKVSDREWRGIGNIPKSGFELRPEYASFDANLKFNIHIEKVEEPKECIAGLVLKGIKKPMQCSQFGKKCTPQNPMGAPMVSSEGACAAYYHFSGAAETLA
ncbi:hydrogenase formation protein HypD [Maribacter halichondriae]|uniref:hydrogenase formation protein HypD n=1 Tax=Maribacter halichondriae TaxID=2980554 RepID=UPI002358F5B6|nr:hydrogenase formation protein HypD [Maribacter sp. Hal144]